jgi:hypothetical protein
MKWKQGFFLWIIYSENRKCFVKSNRLIFWISSWVLTVVMYLYIEFLLLCQQNRVINHIVNIIFVFNSNMPNTIQLDMKAIREEPWYHQASQITQVTILAGWLQMGPVHLPRIEVNLCMRLDNQLLRVMGLWEATVMILWGALNSSLSGGNLKGASFCS